MAKKSEKVKLSPPWDGHMSMLSSFFAGDKRVRVGYCEDGCGCIEVFDGDMYQALEQVLRKQLRFGNVRLEIRVVPANCLRGKGDVLNIREKTFTDLAALKVVLKENPAFSKIRRDKSSAFDFVFVLFKPVVLQWYNDNLGNPWKLTTSTHELAADWVFKAELGVSFTTEPPKGAKFAKPVRKEVKR